MKTNLLQIIFSKGDWGLGIGDWGLGIGDWAQSPIPNPQSPIPNPQLFLQSNFLVKYEFQIFKNKQILIEVKPFNVIIFVK